MRDDLALSRRIGGTFWFLRLKGLREELRRHDRQTAARGYGMELGGFPREEIVEFVAARELERQEIQRDIDEIESGKYAGN